VQRSRRFYTPGKSNLNNPSKTRRRRDSFLGLPGDKRPGFKLPVSANRFRHQLEGVVYLVVKFQLKHQNKSNSSFSKLQEYFIKA
jgi:hypothetical protein